MLRAAAAAVLLVAGMSPASAGPPYLSDDPEPTDYRHYEIYAFGNGDIGKDDSDGEAGVDFNYGAAPDLQLTAVLPLGYSVPSGAAAQVNLGSVELGMKYRFLHRSDTGWDVSVFPRVFLPAGSAQVGENHVSLLLPLWFEKDWGERWSTFGGGGCVLNRGGRSHDYCLGGWALAYQLLPKLQIGGELFHQMSDEKGGLDSTIVGAGARYDASDTYHLLAYVGRNVQNRSQDDRFTWYGSILFTF